MSQKQLENHRRQDEPGGDERLRVCHLVVLPELAGSQRMMFDLCRRLDPDQYDRHVICQSEGVLTDALREAGIPWHLVPSLRRSVHPIRDLTALNHITTICRQQRFDIVHTHNSKGGILGRLGAWRAGTPGIVHHVQGFAFHEFSSPVTRGVYSSIERLVGRVTDRVIFVNDEERLMSVEKGWLSEQQCVTIYNGIDLTQFDRRNNLAARDELRRAWGIAEDETAIMISGRLEPQKQPLILPAIAAKVEELCPHGKWRFIVAGSGTLELPLREEFNRRGLLHRCRPIGWHPHPWKVVAACDLALLPSLWEGLPLSLIEAQAGSLPIVASDIKGNREVVTPETGYLCHPKDPVVYATRLASLITDDGLRQRMGIAARQRAESEFDATLCFQRVVRLYEDLKIRRRSAARATPSRAA